MRSRYHHSLVTILALSLGACSVTDFVSQSGLPPEVRDPAALQSADGALQLYRGAVLDFMMTFGGRQFSDTTNPQSVSPTGSFVLVTGLMTDEMEVPAATVPTLPPDYFDLRGVSSFNVPPGNAFTMITDPYNRLQIVRGGAQEARGMLAKYGTAASPALSGHLLALEAMADVMLGELYCSGVPLSTLNFGADYTYKPGSSSAEVFQQAVALFDSAITLSSDSVRIQTFAKLGKARALLNLGNLSAAAQAVAGIPTNYQYNATYTAQRRSVFWSTQPNYSWAFQVATREGRNGQPFGLTASAGGDPRSLGVGLGNFFSPYVFPVKYTQSGTAADGTVPIAVANGIEARLIEAEADLKAGGTQWLSILNALRTTSTTCTVKASPSCASTAPAGTGGIAGLPLLTDPGLDPLPAGKSATDVRVDLLFQERAQWLFLTGHRQGDLRRLVRQYGRRQDTVYPTGGWPSRSGTSALLQYGSDVNLPVPAREQQLNHSYTGCINYDA